MIDIKKIADEADMILNGYAYTRKQNIIQVLNLNNPKSASVLSLDGDVLETTMDDIELSIILDYYNVTANICSKSYPSNKTTQRQFVAPFSSPH